MTLSWGVFLLVLVAVASYVFGIAWSIGLLLGGMAILALSWWFPYLAFFVVTITAPLLGLMVSIPVETLQFGQRAVGASIDVGVGELLASIVLLVWAGKTVQGLWVRRSWGKRAPVLPLLIEFSALSLAHLLSGFSSATPDPWLILKYSLRPVFSVYALFVLIPANFLQTWRRVRQSTIILCGVAGFFAIQGAYALFMGPDATGLVRAHPLTTFGIPLLGGNHHALAELLVFAAPAAWMMSLESSSRFSRRALRGFSGALFLVTLLTFARAAWLTVVLQFALFAVTAGRAWVLAHRRTVAVFFCLLFPLVIFMGTFSLNPVVESSTAARSLLTDIALDFFSDHPLLGVGAGTFPDRVSRIWAFTVEYGDALDAHGIIQKLLAETGLLGLLAFGFVVFGIAKECRLTIRSLTHHRSKLDTYVLLSVACLSPLFYQLFSSTPWSARVWLPVGIFFAGSRVFRVEASDHDPDFLHSHLTRHG